MLKSTALLVLLTTFLSSMALASSSSYTILLPCGDASSSSPSHAIIPDSSCQKISSNGAFTLAQLGELPSGTKLGFSATADCKQTYTPKVEELVELQKTQTCRGYVIKGTGVVMDGTVLAGEKGAERREKGKRQGEDGQQPPQQPQQPQQRTGGGLVKRIVNGGGDLHKRQDGERTPEPVTPGRVYGGGGSTGPEASKGEAAGQTPLAYVMLVSA